MGCWNGTCLISNLPIEAGERVVAFIIEYASFSDGFNYSGCCHPTYHARPISLPIYAEYDDYGGIEGYDENSIAVRLALDLFKESNFGELICSIERDKKTIMSDKTNKEVGVGLVMIHESIFDALADSNAHNNIVEQRIKQGIADLHEHGYLGFFEMVDVFDQRQYNNMFDFVRKQNDNKIESEFVNLVCKSIAIQKDMSDLRKIWFAPSGKGSQDCDLERHFLLSEQIGEHISKKEAEAEEENY